MSRLRLLPTDGDRDHARLFHSVKPCALMVLYLPSCRLMVSVLGFEVFANIINPTRRLLSTKLKAVLKMTLRNMK